MLFSSEVTADSFCHEVKKDNKDFLICDHVTPKNIFNGSKTIERYKYVKISNSSIIHIQLFRFKNIVFLQIINSLLEKIPYGGFSSSPNLEELHLELNEIEVIPYGAFPNFIETQSSTKQNYNTGTASKLKVLDLSSNSIHLIEDKSLTTESLRKLNLQRNRIKHIDGKFRYLTGLEELQLDGNRLTNLRRGSFGNLHSLRRLSLSDNPIKYISYNSFYALDLLSLLNLDETRITSVNWALRRPNSLALRRLEYLQLASTELTGMPEEFFTALPNLKRVHLENNRWTCYENLRFLQTAILRNSSLFENVEDITCWSPADFQGELVRDYKNWSQPTFATPEVTFTPPKIRPNVFTIGAAMCVGSIFLISGMIIDLVVFGGYQRRVRKQ
ncbi:hypothetical protein RRG08_011718 [Elysia crispata]|uniref:Uncharacterized protein n=1 Tax=Elysia crispata TaxID=231223 RepID=A0AAE1AGQ1_9GAST|nr:hypothetical protein RRG08_011718 [Elysia crispata]